MTKRRSPARRRGGAFGALDLGTNNCRLLVARPSTGGFDVIDSFSRIVRLGEGLAGSGRLGDQAMARTLAALRVCARMLAHHEVRASRAVATEACRRAANGAEFLDRVERATGLILEVLPHEHEAHLALLGCLTLIDPATDHVLLMDVGGGSTELLWLDRRSGDPGVVRFTVSLPVGVVSLAETFSGDPDGPTFEAMSGDVGRMVRDIERWHGLPGAFDSGPVQLIGTSGTVTTLAAVLLDLPRYERRRIDGLTVEIEAIGAVARRLRGMGQEARRRHPCIGPGRADLVVPGAAILEAVLQRWPISRLSVADRGLREGILHGLMGRRLEDAVRLGPAPGRDPPGPRDRLLAPCGPCSEPGSLPRVAR
jgi:exopolyphosphatase/guanosine-5'-triphosphate,3'-diphosphate pyrophosphatase